MASHGTGQRPGDNSSFLKYVVGQRAKSGQGLQALDAAMGVPTANANVPTATTPDTQAGAVPAPPAASNPPLTTNSAEMIETQPPPLRLLDQDRYYRDMGRLPTAADLASTQFAARFRATEGRAPTKQEVIAHLYRRPDTLPQVTQDFQTE